ncbi:hypothetical protein [Parafrankia discariae]|uniref:hypothetical protein n=1 Tax=Parafrankia discariae TaxID=365528 RepID=UPI000477ED0F|nr:hypothetical protein [Parafrankia discariae]
MATSDRRGRSARHSRPVRPGRSARHDRSATERALDYAGSAKNIAGCVAASGGLGLFFGGVVGAPEWPFVVTALYAIGALVAPAPRRRAGALPPPRDPEELRSDLAAHDRRFLDQLPPDVETAYRKVTLGLRDLLERPALLRAGSPDTLVVERMVVDYLPTSVEAYLELPRAFADSHLVDGRLTARELLLEQLELLATAAEDVTTSAAWDASQRLAVQSRFLAERFGRTSGDLTLGDS